MSDFKKYLWTYATPVVIYRVCCNHEGYILEETQVGQKAVETKRGERNEILCHFQRLVVEDLSKVGRVRGLF